MRFQVNLVHMLNSIHLKMLYDNEWAISHRERSR
ncbi:hypothetical protein [Klebsiella phage ST405-OXA48phi1.1]|nr:hypothetical protein [Klebsiella phage ST405-OXA48phi1.1]